MKKAVNNASKKVKVHKRKVAKKVGAKSAKNSAKTAIEPTTITKLPGRQTNNSLSSITAGNILIETTNTVPSSTNTTTSTAQATASKNVETTPASSPASSPRKKKNKAAEAFTETDEVLQIGMHKVLESVKNHDDAWPFMDPVEEDIAPRYYTIIRRPMDLLKMEEKLDNGEYLSFHDFRNDFKLIVNNCRLYNGQANEYSDMVNNLQIAFEKATKKYFDQNSSDEEGYLEYPELKSNVFKEKIKSKTELLMKEKKSSTDTEEDEEKEEEFVEPLKSTKNQNKKSKNGVKIAEKKKSQNLIKNHKVNDTKQKQKFVELERGAKRKRKERIKDKIKKQKIKQSSSQSYDEEESENDAERDEPPDQSSELNNYHESSSESEVFEDSDLDDDKKKPPNKTIKKSRTTSVESPLDNVPKKHKAKIKKCLASDTPTTPVKRGKRLKDDPVPKETDNKLTAKHKKLDKTKTSDKSRKILMKDNHKKGKPSKRKQNSQQSDTEGSIIQDVIDDNEESLLQSTDDEKDEATALLLGNLSNYLSSDDNFVDSSTRNPPGTGAKAEKNIRVVKRTSKTTLSETKLKSKKKKDATEKNTDQTTKYKRKYNKNMNLDDNRLRSKSPEKNKPSASGSNKKPKYMQNLAESPPQPHASTEKCLEDGDLHSTSSISRSSSPFPSFYSNSSHSDDELNDLILSGNAKNTPKKQKQTCQVVTPEFQDKFDLIKQRRAGRTKITTPPANDDRWDQIVKEAEKIKESYARSKAKAEATANASLTEGKIVEKNLKLKETIEKLKMKNEKNKERQGLIDEIFGMKPSKHIHDEKTIVEKLRETYGENKASSLGASNAKSGNKTSEYDFVDDNCETKEKATSAVTGKKPKKSMCKIKSPKENIKRIDKKESGVPSSSQVAKQKKDKKMSNQNQVAVATTSKSLDTAAAVEILTTVNSGPPPPLPVAKVQKANMEALELETEQTLKDINKWLENTPRFSEFSSASNSPSRYIIDDLEGNTPPTPAIVTKSDSTEFRKPNNITPTNPSASNLESSSNLLKEINTNSSRPVASCSQNSTIVLMATPQNASSSTTTNKKDQTGKEVKRRNPKDKLANFPRKKEHQRTIERLQPGKTKGNLITSIQNLNKPDDMFPLCGNPGKMKEVKNSLIVKTSESGPKLSLGSVLNTEGFGLIQQHNFIDDEVAEIDEKVLAEIKLDKQDKIYLAEQDTLIKSPERNPFKERLPVELEQKEESLLSTKLNINQPPINMDTDGIKPSQDKKEIEEAGKTTATPNLSAWFKAFGAPKKTAKKADEDEKEEKKLEDDKKNSEVVILSSTKSPSYSAAPRQRKASTGSEISEQSSFSQDLDSPRMGIDERLSGGAYPAPYPSPMGASPIMAASPHTTDEAKSSYSLNGAIKVGFYQDTTTKSSPEKSCSPRELPASPYPQYSQHLYSTSSTSTNSLYGNYNYAQQQQLAATSEQTDKKSPTPFYDQYKPPRSQDSEYSTTAVMSTSPRTFINQPQSEQLSPYQQQPNSPFQQPSTPQYSQQQIASPHPPFQPQNQPAYQQSNHSGINTNNNNNPYTHALTTNSNTVQQNPTQNMLPSPNSPFSPSNNSSPYSQHDPNSPYSQHGQLSPFQPIMSPKSQAPASASNNNTNNGGNINKGDTQTNQQQSNISLPLTQQQSQIPNDWAAQTQISTIPSVLPTLPSNANLSKQANSVNTVQGPLAVSSLQYKVPNQPNLQMNQPIQDQINSQSNLGVETPSMIQNVTPQASAIQQHQQQINLQPAHSQQHISTYLHHSNNYSTENPYDTNNKKKPDQHPRNTEMINLGYSDSSSDNLQHLQSKVPESGQNVPSLAATISGKTKQQEEEDQQLFNRILAYGKGAAAMNFDKPLDISKSKPMDVFNRTNMSFGRNFPDNANIHLHQMNRNLPTETAASSSTDNILDILHKSTASDLGRNLIRSLDTNISSSKSQLPAGMGNESTTVALATQQKVVPPNLSNMQNKQYASQQHMFNMATPSATGMIDPSLRNFPGLGMIRDYHQPTTDERLLGLQPQPGHTAGYYEKSNLFGKNLPSAAALQQMFSSTNMAYNSSQHQQVQQQPQQQQKHGATGLYENSGFHHQSPRMQSQQSHQQHLQTQAQTHIIPSTKKPRKKKGNSTPSVQVQNLQQANDLSTGMLTHHQQQQQNQINHQQQQQGFQSYLKTSAVASSSGTGTSTTDPGATSLKSTSVVPGSAFNFGPTPPLGLGSGLYGENSGGYLDDFRNNPNHYYLPPPSTTHRSTPDINAEKQTNQSSGVPNVAPPTAPTSPYHSFLTQHSRQAAYFMGQQLDPLQQQYIQRQEEFRTQMMLNQGLHGTYPQSGYHPLGRGWL